MLGGGWHWGWFGWFPGLWESMWGWFIGVSVADLYSTIVEGLDKFKYMKVSGSKILRFSCIK